MIRKTRQIKVWVENISIGGMMQTREESLTSLANKGLDEIAKFAVSEEPTDKLIGFNAILVFITLTLIILYHFVTNPQDLLNIIIFLCIGGIGAGIVSLGYVKFLAIVSKVVSQDIFALKVSISILFFDVSCVLIGFLFSLEPLVKIAYALLVIQLLAILILGFMKIPVEQKIIEKKNSSVGIWDLLDKIAIITGIINFMAWSVAILIRFVI